jgi:hypothetical protein
MTDGPPPCSFIASPKFKKSANGEKIPLGGFELIPFPKFLFMRYSRRLKVRLPIRVS